MPSNPPSYRTLVNVLYYIFILYLPSTPPILYQVLQVLNNVKIDGISMKGESATEAGGRVTATIRSKSITGLQ